MSPRYQKPKALILGAAIGLFSSQAALGQDTGALSRFQGIIGVQAGNFQFYDLGKIQADYLNRFSERQVEQKNYVIKAVTDINVQFEFLVKTAIYGRDGLQTIYDEMVESGQPADYGRFLRAVRAYREAKIAFENELGTFANIPGAIQSSTSVSAEGSGIVRLPGLIGGDTIDFTPLIKHYDNQLAPIFASVNALKFNIKTESEGLKTNVGLDFKPSITVSPAAIAAARLEVQRYNTPSEPLKRASRILHNAAKASILKFQDDYGTAQKMRLTVGDQIQQRNELLGKIEEYFFMLSLLRYRYAIPVGGFEFTYDAKTFHRDWFLTDTKDLIRFTTATIFDQVERLGESRNDLEIALSTANSRAQTLQLPSVRNFSDLFSRNTIGTMLNNFASAATAITGQRQLALVNVWLLDLLKKDMTEEMAMMSPTGADDMEDLIRKRYLDEFINGQERSNRFYRLLDGYDPDAALMAAATGLMQVYQNLVREMANFETGRNIALKTLAELEAAQGLNPLTQAGRSRIDRLRKRE